MKGKRKVIFLTLLIASVSLSLGLAFKEKQELYNYVEVFTQALSILKDEYVKPLSAKELIYGALKGMLSNLDPHSQFLTPEEYKELKVETEGEFGGLGIEITIKKGLLTIVTPLEDTPAWEAGLKPQDIIVKIEGQSTRNITLDEAVKKLRGKPGTKVTITIYREKENLVKDVTLTRKIIKIQDVKEAQILEDGIGYIRITDFREHTTFQLDKELDRLKKQGLKALILDLRNNPGGILDAAIDVASRFLEPKTLVVYSQSRNPKDVSKYFSKYRRPLLDIPMVVLINEGSASASEIVAACFQDCHRAIIMGKRSVGKGSIQTLLPLSDGSAMKFTTAYYHSPKGHVIQDKGVEPDIEVEYLTVPLKEDKRKEEEVFNKIEEKPQKSHLLDDYQILRAKDLLKAILVYGKFRNDADSGN